MSLKIPQVALVAPNDDDNDNDVVVDALFGRDIMMLFVLLWWNPTLWKMSRSKAVGVSSTPGFTKSMQEIHLDKTVSFQFLLVTHETKWKKMPQRSTSGSSSVVSSLLQSFNIFQYLPRVVAIRVWPVVLKDVGVEFVRGFVELVLDMIWHGHIQHMGTLNLFHETSKYLGGQS